MNSIKKRTIWGLVSMAFGVSMLGGAVYFATHPELSSTSTSIASATSVVGGTVLTFVVARRLLAVRSEESSASMLSPKEGE